MRKRKRGRYVKARYVVIGENQYVMTPDNLVYWVNPKRELCRVLSPVTLANVRDAFRTTDPTLEASPSSPGYARGSDTVTQEKTQRERGVMPIAREAPTEGDPSSPSPSHITSTTIGVPRVGAGCTPTL